MNHDKYIQRDSYLKKLIIRKDNGEVKIITGPRRCGKSWLLSHIYRDYLTAQGVPSENIIALDFDKDDDKYDFDILDPKAVKNHIYSQIKSDTENYYIFLDEIQELENFERLVNGLNGHDNIDVYVTGSNSRFLSKDIRTIFRGRGDEIRVSTPVFCQKTYGLYSVAGVMKSGCSLCHSGSFIGRYTMTFVKHGKCTQLLAECLVLSTTLMMSRK